ncbi:MAG: MFS transporter [Ruminococcaceae bacterium]|nr:MFS transporter [Oscillospiraceae bacterium]
MATLLLIVIYIGYIGLGIPDSLTGAAWPEIYTEFDLPISWASIISAVGLIGTFCSSLFSPRIINRFGVYRVTVVSTLLTAVSLFAHVYANSFLALCLLSIPLGLGGGAIDAGLNNYTAIHYKAMHINFLHCFYGIGVALSPYLMSYAIAGAGGWRGGYRTVALVQLAITMVVAVSYPLWKKVKFVKDGEVTAEITQTTLTVREMIKIPKMIPMCFMFICSCSIEFVCGGWSSTYLVEHFGESSDKAAFLVVFYYVGLALGRFTAGIVSTKLSGWKIIFPGQAVVIIAITIMALAKNPVMFTVGMFLCSFGNAPLWPNLMYVTPGMFGVEVSQSIMGAEGAAATIGLMVAPLVFGQLAQHIGIFTLPYYLMGLFACLMIATYAVHRKKKA